MLDAPPERRILIVAEALGYGGTESHLVTVLPRLAESGLNISVFCLADRGPRAAELEQAGIRVVTASRLANRRKQRLLYPLQAGLDCRALYAFAREWRPQVAHFFLPGPYLLGTPVAIAAQVPVKVMSRRSLAHYQQNWIGARQLERLRHKRMTAILGNCRAILRELAEEGVPEAKLRLIYNGIDASLRCPGQGRGARGARSRSRCLDRHRRRQSHSLQRPSRPDRGACNRRAQAAGGMADALRRRGERPPARARSPRRRKRHRRQCPLPRPALRCGPLAASRRLRRAPSRANEGFSNAILELMRAGCPWW